jgi:ferredoxin
MSTEKVQVVFIYPDGTEQLIEAHVGLSILEVAKHNDVGIEGACGGGLACATCHVIVEDKACYDALPSPSEEEEDMLDMAFGLEPTSRLCCQLIITKEMQGIRFKIPEGTCNLA